MIDTYSHAALDKLNDETPAIRSSHAQGGSE